MKKRIIKTLVSAGLCFALMSQAALAEWAFTGDVFTNKLDSEGNFVYDADGNAVMLPSGFKTETDTYGDYKINGHWSVWTQRGWTSDLSQDIILTTDLNESFGSYEEAAQMKYAGRTRMVNDMCEWNGYLFVVAYDQTQRRAEDGGLMYANKQTWRDDDAVIVSKQEDGTYIRVDQNGEFLLGEDGNIQEVENFTPNNKYPTINNSIIQIYDITNGNKIHVADWDCQAGLGINGTRKGADYSVCGIDVTDDRIYLYIDPAGYEGDNSYWYDKTRYLGLEVFENSVNRDEESFEIPNRIEKADLGAGNMNQLSNARSVAVASQYLRKGFVGNNLITINRCYNIGYSEKATQNPVVSVTDISNIETEKLVPTQYNWNIWLGYTPEAGQSGATLYDFYMDGNMGYAAIYYTAKEEDTTKYCTVIKAYDLTDPNHPVLKSTSEPFKTESRPWTVQVKKTGNYIYLGVSYFDTVSGSTVFASNKPHVVIYNTDLNKINDLDLKAMYQETPDEVWDIFKDIRIIAPVGNYLFIECTFGKNNNNSVDYAIQLSEDKSEVITYAQSRGRFFGLSNQVIAYGSRLFLGASSLGDGSYQYNRQSLFKISTVDMSSALPMHLKVDKVPEEVSVPYTITGSLSGVTDQGDIFTVMVNDGATETITLEDIKNYGGTDGSGDYWAQLKYTVTEPGEYTVVIKPFNADGVEADDAAETVRFTAKASEVPQEFKLSASAGKIEKAGNISVTPKVTNNDGRGEITAVPAAALYKDGKLVDVKAAAAQTIEDKAYLKSLSEITLSVPEDTDYSKYEIRVFLLNSVSDMKPVAASASIK